MQYEFLLTTVLLAATALCAGATLYLSFLHWKSRKAQPVDPGLPHQKAQRVDPPLLQPEQGDHLKGAKPLLDELLREAPWSATLNNPQPTEEKPVTKKIDESSRQAASESIGFSKAPRSDQPSWPEGLWDQELLDLKGPSGPWGGKQRPTASCLSLSQAVGSASVANREAHGEARRHRHRYDRRSVLPVRS
jgi:hypothetical protein